MAQIDTKRKKPTKKRTAATLAAMKTRHFAPSAEHPTGGIVEPPSPAANIIAEQRAHRTRAKATVTITPEVEAEALRLAEAGCTETEIASLPHMPGSQQWTAHCVTNPALASTYTAARLRGAAIILEEGHQIARVLMEQALSSDSDSDRAFLTAHAKAYVDIAAKVAALRAPKEFGALLKVADADGGKLQINVASFAAMAAAAAPATT